MDIDNLFDPIDEAIKALRKGIPVLIYDSSHRENEIDYVVPASHVDSDVVYEMRHLAGGLICFAMPIGIARILKLRFATEYLSHFNELQALIRKKLRYGDEPAFSIWVNHKDVYTGISDSDRALTIRELYKVVALAFHGKTQEAYTYFLENFVAPGHIPILIGKPLSVRQGHTELSLHLAALAQIVPAVTLCEILSRGKSASLEEVRKISRDRGYPLVSANQIVNEVEKHGEDLYRRYYLR